MKKTDSQLQHDVMAELEWEPSVDHADIGVAVNDGVVTLSGYVKSYAQKVAAEKAVRRVGGVKAIAEEIQERALQLGTHYPLGEWYSASAVSAGTSVAVGAQVPSRTETGAMSGLPEAASTRAAARMINPGVR